VLEEEKLFELFKGLDRAHGTYKIDDTDISEKVSGQAMTLATPPTVDMWRQHLDGKRSLGIVPIMDDGNCNWACIDIDTYKGDVCAQIVQFLKKYKIPFIVCRSKSGGAHVYVFFKEPVPAPVIIRKMNAIAKSMGHEGAEVFPKQLKLEPDQYGNWLNMPYFDSELTLRYAFDRDGQQLDLDQFISLIEHNRLTRKEFEAIEPPKLEFPFADGPPCCAHFAMHGIDEGGRNNALMQMSIYAKNKYGDDWKEWTEKYNELHVNPPLNAREMSDTVFKSTDRRDYGYMCTHPPMVNVCNKRVCMQRQYGVGGAAEDQFEADVHLEDLRKLVYELPNGKVVDDAPKWELTIQGRVIRFPDTSFLQEQKKFATLCINKVNMFPPTLPAARWRMLVHDRLKNVQIVRIPFEQSEHSQTLEHLKDFLRHMAHAKNVAQLMDGLALNDNGVYRFRLESLVDYIREKTRRTVDADLIGEHLEAFEIKRQRSTVRVGTGHAPLVYWEVDNETLQMSESEIEPLDEPDKPPKPAKPDEPGVNF
jgi:hypothetical protein